MEVSEIIFKFASNNRSLESTSLILKSKIIMAKGFIKSSERTFYDENGQMQVQTTQKEFKFKSEEDKFYMVFIDFVK